MLCENCTLKKFPKVKEFLRYPHGAGKGSQLPLACQVQYLYKGKFLTKSFHSQSFIFQSPGAGFLNDALEIFRMWPLTDMAQDSCLYLSDIDDPGLYLHPFLLLQQNTLDWLIYKQQKSLCQSSGGCKFQDKGMLTVWWGPIPSFQHGVLSTQSSGSRRMEGCEGLSS